eukprot:5459833-Prymnesium_polylepis.1
MDDQSPCASACVRKVRSDRLAKDTLRRAYGRAYVRAYVAHARRGKTNLCNGARLQKASTQRAPLQSADRPQPGEH